MKGEYVMIAGWPVQFLPPTGPLVEEALAEAAEADVDGVPVRVFTAEHLAAIALQTGRAKDKARLLQFVEEGALDAARFQAILRRHDLVDAWAKFERQFLSDTP
jgi:predicted DsbA family dithiol-disulfide isomerase